MRDGKKDSSAQRSERNGEEYEEQIQGNARGLDGAFHAAGTGLQANQVGTPEASGEPVVTATPAPSGEPADAAAYTAGTYEATVTGHNAPVTVSVTVSDDAITDVAVTNDNETIGVGKAAIDVMTKRIVEGQSLAATSSPAPRLPAAQS